MWNKEMSVLLSKGLIILTLIMAVSSVGWFSQCIAIIEEANVPPRKLKGVESQGMILSAEDKDGRLVLLTPSDVVTPGCNVG